MSKILTILLCLSFAFTLSAEDLVSVMTADTGEKVALSKVDYLIAADDAKDFSIILIGGGSIDGVKKVTFTKDSGVDEISMQDVLQMFPNPVVSSFTISGHKTGAAINILNMDGKLQKSFKAECEKETIDVSDLAPGYYLLTTERSTIKFIKK